MLRQAQRDARPRHLPSFRKPSDKALHWNTMAARRPPARTHPPRRVLWRRFSSTSIWMLQPCKRRAQTFCACSGLRSMMARRAPCLAVSPPSRHRPQPHRTAGFTLPRYPSLRRSLRPRNLQSRHTLNSRARTPEPMVRDYARGLPRARAPPSRPSKAITPCPPPRLHMSRRPPRILPLEALRELRR